MDGRRVIARVWRGATSLADEDAYADYIERSGMKSARALPGNLGAYALHRPDGDRTEFVSVILWDSLDSIRAFAGDEIERAVFFPEDDRYLVDRDLTVTHYEVGPRPDG